MESVTTQTSMSTRKTAGIIAACTLAMINNIGSGPAITVALPDIGKDLNIATGNLQWIISAYSLTSGCFLLLFGRLADLHGRRNVFLFGAIWTAIWAIGCGLAPSEISLDILRGLQGLGPAAVLPASLGILAHSFELGSVRRTIAFSTFGSGAPIGSAVGNVVASVLTQYTRPSWRSAFYFQAGLAVLTATLGFLAVDKDTHHLDPSLDRRVDWIGAALVTIGLVLLIFTLGNGETAKQHQWRSGYIITLLILSVILLAAFVWWEHVLEVERSDLEGEKTTRAPPLLKMSIFRRAHGKLAVMLCIAFFVLAGFSGWVFYAVLYYQTYLKLDPVHQMLRIFPMSVTGILCDVIVALVAAHIPGIILIVTGCVMTSIAPCLFALINTDSPYWAFGFPAAVASAFGADFIFAGGSLFVAKVALPHEQSLAGGLFNTLAQLGISIGLALTSVVLDKTITKKVHSMGVSVPPGGAAFDNAPPEALLAGYSAVQWLNFAFVMVGLTLAVVFLRDIGVVAGKHPEPENVRAGGVERQEKASEEGGVGLEKPTRDDKKRPLGVEGSEA